MEKDNFKKKFWISIATIVVTIVISSVALYFLATYVAENANAIGATRTETATDDAEFQDLANLQRDTATAQTYQAAMDKLLASQEALITFPTQIDALGREDSVSTDFSYEGTPMPGDGATPGSVTFSLDVSGPIANVISFMKDFESSAPILLASLDTVNVANNGGNYTVSAQGTAFFK